MTSMAGSSVPIFMIICDALLLTAVWLPVPILKYSAEPFPRGFFCNDQSIRYPFKESTVTSTTLYLVGHLVPVFFMLAVEAYRTFVFDPKALPNSESQKPRHTVLGHPIHPYISSIYLYVGYFYLGMAFTVTLTDLGKFTVGRLRPHFIAVCEPDEETLSNCTMTNLYKYIEKPVCNGLRTHLIREAKLSFPSGHSSFSAYTMIYLILYLHSRMIWPLGSVLLKHVLQLVAFALTWETCMSRVTDFKHHWSDVVAGFVLGATVAVVTAYGIVGMFRRPQWIFARSSPYDSQCFVGGQLCSAFDKTDDGPVMIRKQRA